LEWGCFYKPMSTHKHYPTIKDTIWLLGLILLFHIILSIAFAIIFTMVKGIGLAQAALVYKKYPVFLGVINLTTLGLGVWWGFKKTKTDFRQVFPFQTVAIMIFIPLALSVVGLHILISEFDNLLRIILRSPLNLNEFLPNLILNHNLWNSIFVLMIVAPFTEEFLFRGLIFTGYLNNYSFKKAIWVSALCFALFHLNIFQFSEALILGSLCAWLVGKTNSLWPALFAHALNNGIPLLLLRVFKLQIAGYSGQQMTFQPWWFDGIGLLLFLLGIGLFWLLKGKMQTSALLLRPQPVEETGAVNDTYLNKH
jgi:membrane protease YdiL (CAAX protease family)